MKLIDSESHIIYPSSRLNLVTMEWSGLLLLMGYRIFEGNNNAVVVDEEGSKIQDQEVEADDRCEAQGRAQGRAQLS